MSDWDERFLSLYRYYPGVLALLVRLGFSSDEAFDLAQEVFIRVYDHMDAYRGESNWAYLEKVTRRIAYNAIRDRHAGKRSVRPDYSDAIGYKTDDVAARNDDDETEADERDVRLMSAIDQLPRHEREVLLLQLQGHTYDEASRTLGISTNALKGRLHRAMSHLREVTGADEAKATVDFASSGDAHPDSPQNVASQPSANMSNAIVMYEQQLQQASEIIEAIGVEHTALLGTLTVYESLLAKHHRRIEDLTSGVIGEIGKA